MLNIFYTNSCVRQYIKLWMFYSGISALRTFTMSKEKETLSLTRLIEFSTLQFAQKIMTLTVLENKLCLNTFKNPP